MNDFLNTLIEPACRLVSFCKSTAAHKVCFISICKIPLMAILHVHYVHFNKDLWYVISTPSVHIMHLKKKINFLVLQVHISQSTCI